MLPRYRNLSVVLFGRWFLFYGSTGCFMRELLRKLGSNAIFQNYVVYKKLLIKFSNPPKC